MSSLSTHCNIYLIGYMGSGKSYIGKRLAEHLQRRFIDLDDYLEEKEGRTISQIFEKVGEALFRRLERDYLTKTGNLEKAIIATGGGCPCFYDNMEWMDVNGQTVYLKTPVAVLVDRLQGEIAHRPLLAGKSREVLMESIHRQLAEREHYYQQAQIILEYESDKLTLEQLTKVLWE